MNRCKGWMTKGTTSVPKSVHRCQLDKVLTSFLVFYAFLITSKISQIKVTMSSLFNSFYGYTHTLMLRV